MTTNIFTDPSFAGLHWSIPHNTPVEERERAHLIAACAARSRRDREVNRPRSLAYDPQRATHLLKWPNGSLTWMSELQIAAEALQVVL